MTERRFKIMEDAVTNKEHIVDMNNGEPLTLDETCILLNELHEENQTLKEKLCKIEEITIKLKDE